MANLTQTNTSGFLPVSATMIPVVSAAGIVGPTAGFMQKLYLINPNATRGELMIVTGAPVGLQVPVARLDGARQSFASGATVLIAPVDPTQGGFYEHNPVGAPLTNLTLTSPYLNVTTGEQWLYTSTGWVPGFNNPSSIKGESPAVASAAGVILPSGPLFHVTGTAAITGFTIPVGFAGGSITIIPDGVFTWTAAGNIALAGTAVVGKAIVFTWDPTTAKFYPSYIA